MSTPGSIMPGGIILIDEPAFIGVTTFAANGEVLLNIELRPGADLGQIIMGLTPNQAVQLIERLLAHNDACTRAIAAGNGGARFAEKRP